MLKVLALIAALAVVASTATAVTRAAAAKPHPVTVEIRDMKYASNTLTIPVGTKVTWINKDQTPHTVTDRGRRFASAALDTGDSYSYTLTTPGEFTYFCTIHPFMIAKVIVKQARSSH
jgi:plastocyanin